MNLPRTLDISRGTCPTMAPLFFLCRRHGDRMHFLVPYILPVSSRSSPIYCRVPNTLVYVMTSYHTFYIRIHYITTCPSSLNGYMYVNRLLIESIFRLLVTYSFMLGQSTERQTSGKNLLVKNDCNFGRERLLRV